MALLQPTAKQIKSATDYKVTKFKINMRDLPAMDKIEFIDKAMSGYIRR